MTEYNTMQNSPPIPSLSIHIYNKYEVIKTHKAHDEIPPSSINETVSM